MEAPANDDSPIVRARACKVVSPSLPYPRWHHRFIVNEGCFLMVPACEPRYGCRMDGLQMCPTCGSRDMQTRVVTERVILARCGACRTVITIQMPAETDGVSKPAAPQWGTRP
jgi:hypothetical protein